MPISKRHREALRRALDSLTRAERYVDRPDVAVCRKGGPATTTLHYTRPDGSTLYEVDKFLGSDLMGLGIGIVMLRGVLAEADNPCPQKGCPYRAGHEGAHRGAA